jgi:hypothetical protein
MQLDNVWLGLHEYIAVRVLFILITMSKIVAGRDFSSKRTTHQLQASIDRCIAMWEDYRVGATEYLRRLASIAFYRPCPDCGRAASTILPKWASEKKHQSADARTHLHANWCLKNEP